MSGKAKITAQLPEQSVDQYCLLDIHARRYLFGRLDTTLVSARSYSRILKSAARSPTWQAVRRWRRGKRTSRQQKVSRRTITQLAGTLHYSSSFTNIFCNLRHIKFFNRIPAVRHQSGEQLANDANRLLNIRPSSVRIPRTSMMALDFVQGFSFLQRAKLCFAKRRK